MKGFFARIAAIVAVSLVTACGNEGSPAPAPTDVTVVPGDSRVALSWTMSPDVEYWVFYAPASSISLDNWASIPGSRSVLRAASPQVIAGLTNGTTYAFTINGRYNHGPGGPGSPSVSAIPRLAGAQWTVGTPLAPTTNDLRGIAYGAAFVTVGTNGAMFSSPDGITWTPQNSTVAMPLNAVAYGGNYVAVGNAPVGAGGVILQSSDAVTWTSRINPNATNNLNAVTNGGGVYVAAGASGTVITSTDAVNWTPAASSGITSNDLYAVTFGNGLYVAVGAGGTLLTSPDASAWTVVSSNTLSALRGVAYGSPTVAGNVTPTYVAAGDGGALVTSINGGVTWTLQAPIGGTAVNAVTYGHQFIAVGDGGSIFISVDGVTWQAATSVTPATTENLYAVAVKPADSFNYGAVGAAGVNLSTF